MVTIDPSYTPHRVDSELRRPRLTRGWIRRALRAGREAFEREMQRDRALLEERFQRYWEEQEERSG